MVRVGIGYDIHKLVKNRPLVLGGVKIPYKKGLSGHSDADVILHAICDALLGAAAERDIGEIFPNSEPRYKGISSLILLQRTARIVEKKGYKINNVDGVLILEEPKIAPYKDKMRKNIARVLKLKKECVNIKATTNEGCGSIGRKEAVAAYAVVSVKKGS